MHASYGNQSPTKMSTSTTGPTVDIFLGDVHYGKENEDDHESAKITVFYCSLALAN